MVSSATTIKVFVNKGLVRAWKVEGVTAPARREGREPNGTVFGGWGGGGGVWWKRGLGRSEKVGGRAGVRGQGCQESR